MPGYELCLGTSCAWVRVASGYVRDMPASRTHAHVLNNHNCSEQRSETALQEDSHGDSGTERGKVTAH